VLKGSIRCSAWGARETSKNDTWKGVVPGVAQSPAHKEKRGRFREQSAKDCEGGVERAEEGQSNKGADGSTVGYEWRAIEEARYA